MRHIERTKLLLHLIDGTSEDIIGDYQTIQQELKTYGRGLGERPQILAVNKIDAVDQESGDLAVLAQQLQQLSTAPVYLISAVARHGLEPMLQEIWRSLEQINSEEADISHEQSVKLH